MKHLIALSLFLSLAVGAKAQLSEKDMVGFLTNNDKRAWSYNGYKVTMGASCQGNGQEFIFYKDHRIVWKRCTDGKPQVQTLHWDIHSVSKDNPDEWVIEFREAVALFDERNGTLKNVRLDFILPEMKKRDKTMFWRALAECKSCGQTMATLTSLE